MRLSIVALGIWACLLSPILYFGITTAQPQAIILETPGSNRAELLTKFMEQHHFSKPYYTDEYIKAADRYHISWRLLTAISLAESSGCKHYLYNNCWGYGSSSGLVHFSSIPEGIDYVSRQLGTSHYYKHQSFDTIAWNYGPHTKEYVLKIKTYLKEISP